MVYESCLQIMAIARIARGSSIQAMGMNFGAAHMISLISRACTMRRTVHTARSRCK